MRMVFTGTRARPFYQAVWDDLYDLSMQTITEVQ